MFEGIDLATGINNQMSHTEFPENHWACSWRLICLCIKRNFLLQVILKDPVYQGIQSLWQRRHINTYRVPQEHPLNQLQNRLFWPI